MRVHVGTSGYAYKEWKGLFYPEKIAPKDMLGFYSGRFSVVEINNTFYHMPREKDLQAWSTQTPNDFVFAFKASRLITHIKRLKDVAEPVDYLLRTLSAMGPKLGPLLFQFPEFFRVNHERLEQFLELIPLDSPVQCAFDFRSATWLDEQTKELLRSRDFSLCTEDRDESPAEEIISTARWGYLRLRRQDYTDDDLSKWADRVLSQDWDEAFVFFKHEEQALGPQLALRFVELTKATNG